MNAIGARLPSAPRAGAALLVLLAGLVLAGAAHAAWMIPPSPCRAKDFTVIKHDGWYHIFYILSDPTVPYDSTERALGHAVSRDLFTWTQLTPVLAVRPNAWDNAKIWSPHVVEVDGVFYMFYTGVSNVPGSYAYYQRTGLATSTDLINWNRLDQPVFSCEAVRWTYCDPLTYGGGEFRDPFVMRDPATGGWLMYYTARPSSSPQTYVAGMAASSGDLTQWVNREPLWITHIEWSGTQVVESPHVFKHNGLYYLVFTGNGDQPLRVATGPDPTGDASSWYFHGSLGLMLGLDTGQWFASEYFVDGTHEYFAFINYDRADIREIVWSPGWQFSLQQPSQYHVHHLTWDRAQTTVGETVRLRIEAVNTLGRGARIEAVGLDADGNETPIPCAQIGLPDSIPTPGPVTDFWWIARGSPDPQVPAEAARIVVRMKDHTASTAPITLMPYPWQPAGEPGVADGTPQLPRVYEEFGASRPRAELRGLRDSPLGGPALLVDLDGPAPARLEVFDLAGRRVRSLADRTLPAGASVITWDGRDGSGTPARRGVYFARLTIPGLQRTVRILLVR